MYKPRYYYCKKSKWYICKMPGKMYGYIRCMVLLEDNDLHYGYFTPKMIASNKTSKTNFERLLKKDYIHGHSVIDVYFNEPRSVRKPINRHISTFFSRK